MSRGELGGRSWSSWAMRGLSFVMVSLAAGCIGGFDNRVLTVGEVSGQLVGAEAAQARIFLLGQPQLSTVADAAGRFTLSKVPVDDYQLMAIARTTALIAAVHVTAGGTATPSTLTLSGGSPVSVTTSRGGVRISGVSIAVEGTPLTAISGDDGTANLGVLPEACFRLSGSLDTDSVECSLCLTPPTEGVCSLVLPGVVDAGIADGGRDGGHADAGPVDAGPLDAGEPDAGACPDGCPAGSSCDPDDGQCYPCVNPGDCAAGMACVDHACTFGPASCQCNILDQTTCSYPSLCLPSAGLGYDGGWGECVPQCGDDSDCNQSGAYGYKCEGGLCVPQADEIAVCASVAALGEACLTTGDCTRAGLVDGFCATIDGQQECSVTCAYDSDCPGGWRCDYDDNGGVCHPS